MYKTILYAWMVLNWPSVLVPMWKNWLETTTKKRSSWLPCPTMLAPVPVDGPTPVFILRTCRSNGKRETPVPAKQTEISGAQSTSPNALFILSLLQRGFRATRPKEVGI